MRCGGDRRMGSAVFYYGRDLPSDQLKAASAGQARIVLQPYHPLLAGATFWEYFPDCSLFVYWNPTGVHADTVRDAREPVKLLKPDPVWNLNRLDLTSAATRRFAVRQGVAALNDSGKCVTGLFVDDLDLWSGSGQRDFAIEVVGSVLTQAGRDARLFINRAFPLWPLLPSIDAVLLEGVTPGLVDRMSESDLSWVEHNVLPAVQGVRQRGAAIFGLTYESVQEDPPRRAVSIELAALSDDILYGCRSLDIWPEEIK
jgi:hypothetical protein